MSMSAAVNESQLISQAIAGNRASLAELLLLHYDALHRHVDTRISQNLQGLVRAEDILQQAFVRAANAIATFENRHEGAFGGWLKTIADNLVRDAEKGRRRERRAGALPASSTVSPPLQQLVGVHSSPSRQAARGENLRNMKVAMGRLPDDQREVLHRRYFLGETLQEIAAATGRSKSGVRGLCFRARKNLRQAMGRTSLYFTK
jgi:RNA polymerase sigma-70 factor (ECF subfamily)